MSNGPACMNAPDGPVCGCGAPSTRESGRCEACVRGCDGRAPCPHGMPAGKSCAVRCMCSHRCDDHDHGANNAECWGDSESAGPAVAGASLCECERFASQSGEG